jgi:hypothetical protein
MYRKCCGHLVAGIIVSRAGTDEITGEAGDFVDVKLNIAMHRI